MKKIMLFLIGFALILGTATFAFAQYKDGEFTAKDVPDRQKYVGNIKLSVSGGKITKVEYDEFKGNESKKASNYVNTEMKKRSGIAFDDAVKKLEEALVRTQDPGKIDKITGATGVHKRFIDLANKALGK